MIRISTGLLIAFLAVVSTREASTLIRGDAGNTPIPDPGWPKGSAAIFNHPGRAAWWEGPPFGGGQWHSECRGDAKALNAVLADFAKLEVAVNRVIVHDGIGHSFWLAPNREPEKLAAAKVDWIFMVWQGDRWETLRKLPADLNPTAPDDASPPAEIDVFAGGLRWADVIVPKGVEVVDRRLAAHGFSAEDGVVFEGKVVDLATNKPIVATARLERVEPKPTGGYLHSAVAEAKSDAQGRWFLKKVPAAWVRVVVESEGFAPRVVGYDRLDAEPRWRSFDTGLSRVAAVSGRVVDEDGKPLADVVVRFADVGPTSGGRYESPTEASAKTDAGGRFRFDRLPAGGATIWLRKPGYIRPGLGLSVATPKGDVELSMIKSSGIRVRVDFAGKDRPEGYIVQLEPEGGDVVGSHGGSASIDAENRVAFDDLPPGRYVLKGRPNPSSGDQEAEPVPVELKGGAVAEVTLKAK